ncbi:MAG: hypothetical protein GY714_31925 [Desulfobacterales bacterium]|nr:hypothetical protein [Desulfobacterales bacterium]
MKKNIFKVSLVSFLVLLLSGVSNAGDIIVTQEDLNKSTIIYNKAGGIDTSDGCTINKDVKICLLSSSSVSLKPEFGSNLGSNLSVVIGDWSNLNKDMDIDQNGIKDWWEIKNFEALLGSNINSDSDNDGFSNYAEYISNTNPKDSGSKPVANSVISYEYDSIGRIKKITRNAQ